MNKATPHIKERERHPVFLLQIMEGFFLQNIALARNSAAFLIPALGLTAVRSG